MQENNVEKNVPGTCRWVQPMGDGLPLEIPKETPPFSLVNKKLLVSLLLTGQLDLTWT